MNLTFASLSKLLFLNDIHKYGLNQDIYLDEMML